MKKLLYLVAGVALMGGFAACSDDNENPGDFNLASELSLGSTIYSRSGKTFELEVARQADTTYRYSYTVSDTLKDENGDPVIDASGKLQITIDTLYYFSKKTAKLIEMKRIELPMERDTFALDINSNARWKATQPTPPNNSTTWFFNNNSTTAGGGDGRWEFNVSRNSNNNPRQYGIVQEILTSDSMIIYRIPFIQLGRRGSK